jgi:hypothetical protein
LAPFSSIQSVGVHVLPEWLSLTFSHSADSILYTVTKDSVLRIFLPVLDSPQLLQLHASLDLFSSLPFSIASDYESACSSVFWMDREVLGNTFNHTLKTCSEEEDGRRRRITEIKEEGWDMFLRILADGSIVVTAVAVSNYRSSYMVISTMHLEYRPQASNTAQAIYHPATTTLVAS